MQTGYIPVWCLLQHLKKETGQHVDAGSNFLMFEVPDRDGLRLRLRQAAVLETPHGRPEPAVSKTLRVDRGWPGPRNFLQTVNLGAKFSCVLPDFGDHVFGFAEVVIHLLLQRERGQSLTVKTVSALKILLFFKKVNFREFNQIHYLYKIKIILE